MLIAMSGDWHVGAKSDSVVHNSDIYDFTTFMVSECRKRGVHTFVHAGDFFDRRDKIGIESLDWGIKIAELLSNGFLDVHIIKGNHDIMYKDSRKISSLNAFKEKFSNLVVYDEISAMPNLPKVLLVPWLCSGEEYDGLIKLIKKTKPTTVIGHFEFSSFRMNDHYVMEHGQSHKELHMVRDVFSAHYHTEQEKDNVTYLGSPIPMDYGNANEFNHGFVIYDTDTGEKERVIYSEINYISLSAREILENDMSSVPETTSVKVIVDEELTDVELMDLESKLNSMSIRDKKVVYTVSKANDAIQGETKIGDIMSVDQAVLTHLTQMMDIPNISKDVLVALYQQAKDAGDVV